MNERERFTRVLRGDDIDRTPAICPGGMMNMITTDLMKKAGVTWPEAHLDAEKMARLAKASYDEGCFDNIGLPFCMTIEAEGLGAHVNMGSAIFEPHVSSYVIDSVTEWHDLTPMDLNKGRAKVVIDAIKLLRDQEPEAPIVGNVTGPISVASSVMEPTNFYKELRKKKDIAHEYMTFVTEENIRFANAMIEAGADIITISDPSGTGEILGPKLFDEFVVKYLNMLIDGLNKDKLIGTVVHICGDMKSVYEQVNKVRSDVLSFDSAVPMVSVKKNLPDRVIMGNVSTYTIEFGTPENVERLTRNCVKNGSDIIAPACGLGAKSPLTNVQAILKALKEDANA